MTTTATCHTNGCPSDGDPVELDDFTDPDTGAPYVYSNVVCGACGQPITDLQPDISKDTTS